MVKGLGSRGQAFFDWVEESGQTFFLEDFAPFGEEGLSPGSVRFERQAQGVKMFAGVVKGDDFDGPRKAVFGDAPNPFGSVAEENDLTGVLAAPRLRASVRRRRPSQPGLEIRTSKWWRPDSGRDDLGR